MARNDKLLSQDSGDTKISNFRSPLVINKDIGWFQISVNYVLGVNEYDAFGYFDH